LTIQQCLRHQPLNTLLSLVVVEVDHIGLEAAAQGVY
jgi:hypothetical protein